MKISDVALKDNNREERRRLLKIEGAKNQINPSLGRPLFFSPVKARSRLGLTAEEEKSPSHFSGSVPPAKKKTLEGEKDFFFFPDRGIKP